MRVTNTEFIFPSKGGERAVKHDLSIPENATNLTFDPESLEITYSVPNEPLEDGTPVDPTEHTIPLSQDVIDAALAESQTPQHNVTDLIAALWEDFNRYAVEQTDINSRSSISLILANPDSTAQQLERAAEWGEWWASHWTLYGQKRAEIVSTSAPVTYTFTHAPWSIWEISE